MGFWQWLAGSEEPQHKDPNLLVPELVSNHRAESRLVRQLHTHAELSPHQAGKDQLRAAADEQKAIAQRLSDKVTELGGECVEEDAPPTTGRNHWDRVVQDLEESQALAQRYNEQAIFWDPDLPDATQFFLALERDKKRLNAFLRDIALRADPHAID